MWKTLKLCVGQFWVGIRIFDNLWLVLEVAGATEIMLCEEHSF